MSGSFNEDMNGTSILNSTLIFKVVMYVFQRSKDLPVLNYKLITPL